MEVANLRPIDNTIRAIATLLGASVGSIVRLQRLCKCLSFCFSLIDNKHLSILLRSRKDFYLLLLIQTKAKRFCFQQNVEIFMPDVVLWISGFGISRTG